MSKPITPQEQARIDQARRDMQAYWQQTPISDRTKVIESVESVAPEVKPQVVPIVPVQKSVQLNDLADFMAAHPAAKIVGTPNDGAPWPRIVLPAAAATASAASGAGE